MEIRPEAHCYQLTVDGEIDDKTNLVLKRKCVFEPVTVQKLIYLVTLELRAYYNVCIEVGAATFSLRKPIYIDVNVNQDVYSFVCHKIAPGLVKSLKPEDFPFRLKKTLFLIRPKGHEVKKTVENSKQIDLVNLDRILNAIESRMIKEVRSFSPILYTGMTN